MRMIILVYVPSEELVADMLTKATTGAKFKYLRRMPRRDKAA